MVKFQIPNHNTFQDMNYYPMNYYPVIFGQVRTDRRTDRKRRTRAHRAKCTGGLKKPVYAVALVIRISTIMPMGRYFFVRVWRNSCGILNYSSLLDWNLYPLSVSTPCGGPLHIRPCTFDLLVRFSPDSSQMDPTKK